MSRTTKFVAITSTIALFAFTLVLAPVSAHGALHVRGNGTFLNDSAAAASPLADPGDKVSFGINLHLFSSTPGVTASVVGGSGTVRNPTQGITATLNPACGSVISPDIGHVAIWGTADVTSPSTGSKAQSGWLFFATSHDNDAVTPDTVGPDDRFLLVLVPPTAGASTAPLACTNGPPLTWEGFASASGMVVWSGMGPGNLKGEITHT